MGKKADAPATPDYESLARQQATLDRTAAYANTTANRPTQVTPWGTSSWSNESTFDDAAYQRELEDWNAMTDDQREVIPRPSRNDFYVTNWTQNLDLNPLQQRALDNEFQFNLDRQNTASDILGRVGDDLSNPMDFSNLPELQGFDFSKLPELADSGFGAVQEVQDAMMARLNPERQRTRDTEINRLKAQGIPEDSRAFQEALARLDRGDTDAQQQALLAATDAYGDIFNRSLANRGQAFGEQGQAAQLSGQLRQQMLAERDWQRQMSLNDFLKLTTGTAPGGMQQMPGFMAATGYSGPNLYGAARDQYTANLNSANANNAATSDLMGGLFGLGGAALGAPAGGLLAGLFSGGG